MSLIGTVSGQVDSAQNYTDSTKRFFVALPIAFYGEETNVGFGASGGYYYRNGDNKISSIQGNAIYTLKNQVSFSVLPKIYTSTRDFYYSGHLKANYYPDKFFGIGRNTSDSLEENYTSKDISVLLQRQRIFFKVMMIGVQAQLNYYQVHDIKTNGQLSQGVVGMNDKLTTGLGLLLTWDDRDNMFYPSEGEFYKASLMVYSKVFGSDLDFTRLTLDLRNFYGMGGDHVFALQVYGDLTWGDTPFQMMPALGGSDILRGYYKGRFRDKMMACAQAEYRFPIYKWLKGTAFSSVGDVAPDIDKFDISKSKLSYGAGLRARVNPVNVHLRFDVAFTNDREPAYYFTVTEAF
ncbi:MAG: BamA/TamA family outer membrane protein [Bacteroidales bacterium]